LLDTLVTGIIVVLALVTAYFLLKKAVRQGIFEGYDKVKWDLADEDTQKGFQVLAAKLAKSAIGSGIQGALPKIKIEDAIGYGIMKYMGMLPSMEGQPQPQGQLSGSQPNGRDSY